MTPSFLVDILDKYQSVQLNSKSRTTTFGLILGAWNFEILVFEGYLICQWPYLFPERKVRICVFGFAVCFP